MTRSVRGVTLFSGGGGVEALLKDDIDFVAAFEYDAAIAGVYRQNIGDHIVIGDVCDLNYSQFGVLDYGHASPVCKEFSLAKTNGMEGDTDLRSAEAVCRFLRDCTPRAFTLENVPRYRTSASYRRICDTLTDLGYMWHAELLNSADFGVPQTRRRLMLRAVRDSLLPNLPQPQPWVGWYVATEDLLPILPAARLAPWQIERLPDFLDASTLLWNIDQTIREVTLRKADQPSPTVDTGMMRRPSSIPLAFLVPGSNASSFGIRYGDQPARTVGDTERVGNLPRAVLIESKNSNQQRGDGIRFDTEPSTTVITDHKPSHQPKAWIADGRIVQMTARAAARFQSFPDWYKLPTKVLKRGKQHQFCLDGIPAYLHELFIEQVTTDNLLACTVIGNAVPPRMMREIVLPLIQRLQ